MRNRLVTSNISSGRVLSPAPCSYCSTAASRPRADEVFGFRRWTSGNFSRGERQSSDGQRANPNHPPRMSESPTDDVSLIEALAGGDAEAARELYRRHCQPILRFALAMTDCRAAAEDVVHDTFVELLQRPGNYDPGRGSLRAFLYGIARHRIARSVRTAVIAPPDGGPDEDAPGSLAAGLPAARLRSSPPRPVPLRIRRSAPRISSGCVRPSTRCRSCIAKSSPGVTSRRFLTRR